VTIALLRYAYFACVGFTLSACATASGGAASRAVPADYRQKIAQKLRAEGLNNVQSAEISLPFDRFVGLVYGGTRPQVCVHAVAQNWAGRVGSMYWTYYFDDGTADGHQIAMTSPLQEEMMGRGCVNQPLTPFTEYLPGR
jgi:hypothetical protein